MNEFELIEQWCRVLPSNAMTRVGPGDDCAVLDLGVPGRWWLFKTDAVVEGVHFTRAAEPRAVGHKALARCLSDVAAMGGVPTHALVTVGLGEAGDARRVMAAYEGLGALAQAHGVAVTGGETTSSPGRLFFSVSLLGWVEPDRCVLRSGAKPGDALFVTGELGGAVSSGRHLDFEPRLDEARWLTAHVRPHAMIDLSDGLAGDLRHLLKASGVGAELHVAAIPISRAARHAAREGQRTALSIALGEGEDFELLFAVAARRAVSLLDAWKARFPRLRLSCVGRVTGEQGVVLRDKTGVRPLQEHGYLHFKQS